MEALATSTQSKLLALLEVALVSALIMTLIIASLLFGLNHALNTYDPAIGLSSLAWGWALASFAAGLFFGLLREKTGTLLAPGIAHGLLDAVGEPIMKIFGWV
jgi:membrane protease YdiL (CAAX protease family)